jgi:hypothetical protein
VKHAKKFSVGDKIRIYYSNIKKIKNRNIFNFLKLKVLGWKNADFWKGVC